MTNGGERPSHGATRLLTEKRAPVETSAPKGRSRPSASRGNRQTVCLQDWRHTSPRPVRSARTTVGG